ncbi:HPr family phosphocarrier protein [Hahella sp. SMD15-11]|uniref:HPr family phosphocarrier protein n=1 Tax=Thermohahella caldifontis TaxID=3142973 RepID=A0AB39UZ78_9GAMM
MIVERIEIINELGLHARAAAKLVGTASRFGCDIRLTKDGMTVDAKSIMSVMMLAASKGTWIEITAEGEDAEDAIAALRELINNRFGEEK